MRIGKFEIKNYFAFVIFCICILAALAGIVYGGIYFAKSFSLEPSFEELLEEVGKLVELPEGEEPSIATVIDLSQLEGHVFFADAKVGDKVLIFSASRRAILYRPSEKRIIEIGPII